MSSSPRKRGRSMCDSLCSVEVILGKASCMRYPTRGRHGVHTRKQREHSDPLRAYSVGTVFSDNDDDCDDDDDDRGGKCRAGDEDVGYSFDASSLTPVAASFSSSVLTGQHRATSTQSVSTTQSAVAAPSTSLPVSLFDATASPFGLSSSATSHDRDDLSTHCTADSLPDKHNDDGRPHRSDLYNDRHSSLPDAVWGGGGGRGRSTAVFLGADALASLRANDEAVAETALFCARAFAQLYRAAATAASAATSTVLLAAWEELLACVVHDGWQTVLAALHHVGAQSHFFDLVCSPAASSQTWVMRRVNEERMTLMAALIPAAYAEAILQRPVVCFCAHMLSIVCACPSAPTATEDGGACNSAAGAVVQVCSNSTSSPVLLIHAAHWTTAVHTAPAAIFDCSKLRCVVQPPVSSMSPLSSSRLPGVVRRGCTAVCDDGPTVKSYHAVLQQAPRVPSPSSVSAATSPSDQRRMRYLNHLDSSLAGARQSGVLSLTLHALASLLMQHNRCTRAVSTPNDTVNVPHDVLECEGLTMLLNFLSTHSGAEGCGRGDGDGVEVCSQARHGEFSKVTNRSQWVRETLLLLELLTSSLSTSYFSSVSPVPVNENEGVADAESDDDTLTVGSVVGVGDWAIATPSLPVRWGTRAKSHATLSTVARFLIGLLPAQHPHTHVPFDEAAIETNAFCGTAETAVAREEEQQHQQQQHIHAILRVLTNVTNLDACVLYSLDDTPTDGSRRDGLVRLAQYVSSVFIHPTHGHDDTDTLTLALCCAVNCVKNEVLRTTHGKEAAGQVGQRHALLENNFTRHDQSDGAHNSLCSDSRLSRSNTVCDRRHDTSARACIFAQSLIDAHDHLLDTLAVSLVQAYSANATEKIVLGGYYALLIAVLSLAETSPHGTMRRHVVDALSRAMDGTRLSPQATHKPMLLIVAVIQEFVLFQSATCTLTREWMVDVQRVIDAVACASDVHLENAPS